jgi:DNA-binding response OmpR family regulator
MTICRSPAIHENSSRAFAPFCAGVKRRLPERPWPTPRRWSFGPFRLNPTSRVLERDGVPVSLTTGEFAVLHALVTHPGETLSRERLLTLARGRERGAFDRSIDVQMSRLRRLIETDPIEAPIPANGVGRRLRLRARQGYLGCFRRACLPAPRF